MNTVAEMREVAKRMGLKNISKLRKSDLYVAIMAAVQDAHTEAIREDAAREIQAIGENLKDEKPAKTYAERMTSRLHGYKIQRNNGSLSAKQARRIRHKANKERGQVTAAILSSIDKDFSESFER